jgi:hypothetical protein
MIKVNFSQRLISQQINILKLRHLTAGMAIDEAHRQKIFDRDFVDLLIADMEVTGALIERMKKMKGV